MKYCIVVLLATALAACSQGGAENLQYLPLRPQAAASAPASNGTENANPVLPPEVDIRTAETFVRLGYALDRSQRFQSTWFLTPGLRTHQARHLIQLVASYNEFDGIKVAQALAAFEGRVAGVQFGREGSPVIYVELPYWTHQREGATSSGAGARISDEDNDRLVDELRSAFAGKLKADEFSVQRRRVRIWWD